MHLGWVRVGCGGGTCWGSPGIHCSPVQLKNQVFWVLISARLGIGCVPGHGQDSGSHLWRTELTHPVSRVSSALTHCEGLGNANEGPSEAKSHHLCDLSRCLVTSKLVVPLEKCSQPPDQSCQGHIHSHNFFSRRQMSSKPEAKT